MKKVAVIGGAGYVGSFTAHALRDVGYRVVVIDNFSSGHEDAVSNFPQPLFVILTLLVRHLTEVLERTVQTKAILYREVVSMVEGVSGKKINYKIGPRRPGDAAILVADSDKAKRVLGWEPKYSD